MTRDVADLHQKITALEAQNRALQLRLSEAQDALNAISTGEVDALVVYGDGGERIYTLQGADYAYRVMVESIHEGAANINQDGVILYCNKRLSEMLEMPLETVLGSSFQHYLLTEEKDDFDLLIQKGLNHYGRAEFQLSCRSETTIPVLISASAAEVDGRRGVSLVVTDLTEQKQAMKRERELQIRLMNQREEERQRIARNLHDGPLQNVIGMNYALQLMMTPEEEHPRCAEKIDPGLMAIREGLVNLAVELRSVCNELRPPSTIRFGLAKAIQYHTDEVLSKHPDLVVSLELAGNDRSIPEDVSTVLFRVYEECIRNVLRHSGATKVNVRLFLDEFSTMLEIQDDGKGFRAPIDWIELAQDGHLGLVGMRERIESVGGRLRVLSGKGTGTSIQVEVPQKH